MEDVDAAPGVTDSAVSVTWGNISTGGAACVNFSGLFAEATATNGDADIDKPDYIHVDYSIDNGVTWVPLLHFEGAGFGPGSTTNGVFRLDRDLDGEGDASERALNSTAWLYSAVSQPLNGASVLSLRLEVRVDSGDEDAAVDTFSLAASSCAIASPTAMTTTMAASTTTVAASVTTVTTGAASTTAAAIALSLPLLEPFNDRSQMTLSHEFDGDGGLDYFGISNGDQSDFGAGSANPRTYQGRSARGGSHAWKKGLE